MNKTVSVNAIKNGTVIDHIPQGQAINIMRMLKLTSMKNKMTMGLNMKGKKAPFKDLIKIEDYTLSDEDAQNVAVLAPGATISLIEDHKVKQKVEMKLPENVEGILVCPNTGCVTRSEPVNSFFKLQAQKDTIRLSCRYCEKSFAREDIKDYCA